MEESDFFLAAIAELYGQRPLALSPLRSNNPEGKRLYRVDLPEGSSRVVRAYKQSYKDTDMFHWLSRSPSLLEWLQARAAILLYLAGQNYSAPVVIPSRTGDAIVTCEGWHLLMTTFVHGNAKDTQPAKMGALGVALGHLHALSLPEQHLSGNVLADSWWSLASLQDGLHRLTSAAQSIPKEWRTFYDACLHTFHYFLHRSPLPQTLIHGDCWAENGIQTQREQAILIDWECAGLGIPVLDFGAILLHCHFDQVDLLEHQPSPQYQPDPQRIAAVVKGYYRWRQLSSEELDVLLEAIRFSIAWRGAWLFSLLQRGGATERLQRALRSWYQWYVISEEIGRVSYGAIEQV